MPRCIELSGCTAWVVMGEDQEVAILECRRLQMETGQCLKDTARQVGLSDVSVLIGACLADEHDGTIEPLTSPARINSVLDSGTNAGLKRVLNALHNDRED